MKYIKLFEQFDFDDENFDFEEYDPNYDHIKWKQNDTIICIKNQKHLTVGKSYKIYTISFNGGYDNDIDHSVYLAGNDNYLHWYKIKTNGSYNFAPYF